MIEAIMSNQGLMAYAIGLILFIALVALFLTVNRVGNASQYLSSEFLAWICNFVTLLVIFFLIVFIVALVISIFSTSIGGAI